MSGTAGNRRILVIDDEPNVLLALRLLLEALGQEVQAFSDPTEALALFDAAGERFDLLLCDLKMPGIDGLEVLKRTRRGSNSINFVLMSGHATAQDVALARELGATDFLPKPFTADRIKAMLARLQEISGGARSVNS